MTAQAETRVKGQGDALAYWAVLVGLISSGVVGSGWVIAFISAVPG